MKGTGVGTFKRSLATVQHRGAEEYLQRLSLEEDPNAPKFVPIRERLRKWEAENPNEVQAMLVDFAQVGDLSNSYTRPQNVTMAQIDHATPLFEGDELSDLRSDSATLKPGDLVEMSSEGSRRPMLAICLGRINGYEHYYTSSGKWFCGGGVRALFIVNKFVEPEALKDVIAELPSGEVPIEALNALQDLKHGPSRSVGGPLLRKMIEFEQDAEKVYQSNAATLDASSSFIGDPLQHRYLTLHEIADLLLPLQMKVDGKFDAAALYAVHRALLQDEVFFRPLKLTGHRRSYLFEVSPLSEVRIVQKIENMVRSFLQPSQSSKRKAPVSELVYFLDNARRAIDASRKVRSFSRHGLIGPSKSPRPPSFPEWSQLDIEILKFMELWASYQKFPAYSRLQTMGSAILRSLDRYDNSTDLTPATGWTFLQEVSWIPPWEIPSRYRIRFPDVEIKRGGSFTRPFHGTVDEHLKTDMLKSYRKEFNNTVYCIDAESTVDIDDGVSIERTSDPEQYWVHVHVADPASSIPPDSTLAKYAELVPETIYLPGHFARMFPIDVGVGRFSLGEDRPCLTFSALVNNEGAIVDTKIAPHVLKNVVYMTGEDVNRAIGEIRIDPSANDQKMTIGSSPKKETPTRTLTRPEDVTAEQKDELNLLSKVGKAIQGQRLKRGATPFFQGRPTPKISFEDVEQTEVSKGFIQVVGDPSIHIEYSSQTGTDIVENTMRLAGEVAARWCHERGVPIPYRTQPYAAQNAEAVQQYTRDVFYPILESGARPEDGKIRHLLTLLGSDEVSTTPGPNFTLGVDMYTKATSPLRRFTDLVVHWQVEAALLREMESGESLVGNQDDSLLPFTRERLDRMLPMLRVREKQARSLSNGDGPNQWILQALVRAWKFGEGKLPGKFQFTVEHVYGRSAVQGTLNWFSRRAYIRTETMNDVSKMADIRIGDVFEVKLKDVNVHSHMILCEAVKLLERKQAALMEDAAAVQDTAVSIDELPA